MQQRDQERAERKKQAEIRKKEKEHQFHEALRQKEIEQQAEGATWKPCF